MSGLRRVNHRLRILRPRPVPQSCRMPTCTRISLYIQPRARRTEIAGRHGEALKIRVAAPPVDQAANAALLTFIARKLGIRERDVRLVGGATSRHKVLEITGLTAQRIDALLR